MKVHYPFYQWNTNCYINPWSRKSVLHISIAHISIWILLFFTSKICIIYSRIFSILRFPKAKGFLFITLLLWSLKKGKTMVIFQNGFANFLRVFSSLACVQQGKQYTQHVCLCWVFSQIKSIAHTHRVCMCVYTRVCAYLSIFQISYIGCSYAWKACDT